MPGETYRFVQRVFDESGAQVAERELTDFRVLAEDVAFSGVLDPWTRGSAA